MPETNDSAAVQVVETAPPGTVDLASLDSFTAGLAEAGFAVVDDYPANHRLRAEALVAAGKNSDPAGHITGEFIADTAKRLAAEEAGKAKDDARERAEAPSMSWNRDRLVEHATGLGLSIDAEATKATILDAITAHVAAE